MKEPKYTPQLEKKELLTKPVESKPYVDDTSEFDFPFELIDLPRLLAYSTATAELKDLASRTITEGRSYSYFPVVLLRKIGEQQIKYLDLVVKGGGSEIKPNVNLFVNKATKEEAIQYHPDYPIPSEVTVDGKTLKVRYHTKPIISFTSLFGVHSINAGLSDRYMSRYLESKGLRTRAMVAGWELPKETNMSTPDGLISAENFEIKTGVKPGIEIWAMRCKYDMQDILRYIFEMENPDPKASILGTKLPFAKVNENSLKKNGLIKSYQFDASIYSEETKKQFEITFRQLAQEIIRRASYDNDKRFIELAKKYNKDPIDSINLSNFYHDHIFELAEVLGEQFAIMRNEHALSGMFNLQNITLLGELVDHDVTMIDGKVMSNDGHFIEVEPERLKRFDFNDLTKGDLNYFNQLYVGYDGLRKIIRDLSRIGILKIDESEMKKLLKRYLQLYKAQTLPENHIDVLKLAQQNIEEEKAKVKNGDTPDYFGDDGHLSFCEDILEIFPKQK